MGLFDYSSSPLSSILPQSSPYQLPDYANAFKTTWQPQLNSLQFRTGLTLSGSSNFATALNGKTLMNDAMNQNNNSQLYSTSSTDNQQNTTNQTINTGLQILGQTGEQVGGTAGQIMQGASKVGTSIKNLTDASKAAGGFKNLSGAGKAGGIGAIAGAASDMIGSFMPEKTEYSGDKGDITQTMDSVYDGISDAAMSFGPIGMMVGGIMKGGALLGKGMNALGGGTDGMCVCAGTKVFTANGSIVNIEDLKKEDGIIGWDETKKQIVPQLIHNFIEPRQKECVEITLKNGYSIKCSIDHPILSDNNPKAKNKTINGKRIALRPWKFRRADELKVGDFVGLANNIDYWGDTSIPNAYVVGLLIGDGSYGKGASCRLISADPDTWEYLENNNLGVLNHCDDSRPEKYNKEIRTYRIVGGMELLHQLGIAYQTGKDKTLPKNIGKFDKVSACNLLAGLFDTDGSISVNEEKQNYSITLYQSNINLLEEVRIQLHKLGIFSTIGTRKAAKYELGGRIINSNESYRLEIHDISSAIKFYNLIPLNISYKKQSLERIYNMLKDKRVQEHNDISGAKQCKIVSITPIGVQTVYNLQADYNHTYLANCIITHNTTTDAILGSSFLNLTPLGLVNGFGGKTTDTITKDDEAFEQVGSSYTGSNSTIDAAVHKSGKKYGLLSSGARKKANAEIAEAKRQQSIISNISEDVQDRMTLKSSMSAINGNRRNFLMQGGYDQTAVRVGRHGMSLELLEKARSIIKAQQGTKVLDPFQVYLQSLPENQRDSINYRVRDYWEYNGRPKNFDEAVQKGMFNKLSDGWHSRSIAENPNTGEIEYMKSENHPTRYMESDWYEKGLIYNDDGTTTQLAPGVEGYEEWKDFTNNYELQKTSPYWKYVRRKAPIKQETPQHRNGGSIIKLISETIIDLVNPLNIPEFQNGGSINVIPDGALHARKHNMEDADNLTKKGIPVVDNKGEQQAEIERNEIIFRLEVTQKLEELEKKYYNKDSSQKEKDECALEAGELLVKEILHNTDDKTGLIDTLKQGGVLKISE